MIIRMPVKCEWCPCEKCETRYSEAGLNKFAIVENFHRVMGTCMAFSILIIRVPWETQITDDETLFCIYNNVYYLVGNTLYEFLDDAVIALEASDKPGAHPGLPRTRFGERVCGAWEGDEDSLTIKDPTIGWFYSSLYPVQQIICSACG